MRALAAATSAAVDQPREQPPGLRPSAKVWATDFGRHSVPLEDFEAAGPQKNGIPAIENPQFTTVAEAAAWIEPPEPVIELRIGNEVRLYPIQILIWHEIVNDVVDEVPVAVTFCPLCNTALAFDRRFEGEALTFGVTGVLRNSDLVMFDTSTESWWQQFGGEALVGSLTGATLERLPAAIVAFEDAAARNPDAPVLSRETGVRRPYGQNPYPGYDSIYVPPYYPTDNRDDRLFPRERVVLHEHGDDAVAIPFSVLEERERIALEVGGRSVEVIWLPGVTSTLDDTEVFSPFAPAVAREEAKVTGSADVIDAATGARVSFDTPFWFAVAAFRPDIELLRN